METFATIVKALLDAILPTPPTSALGTGYPMGQLHPMGEHMMVQQHHHPIVQYGNTTDYDAGYWFTDKDTIGATVWDNIFGQYLFSFRYMPYLFITTYIVSTLTFWFSMWITYELFWCVAWNGKGRQSACLRPVPENLS